MQGYWLEGGSTTFYFQPFYRWITGLLHAVFGDSSVGEVFWDGACLLAGALLSFRLTRAYAGFRWGLVAASPRWASSFSQRPIWSGVVWAKSHRRAC